MRILRMFTQLGLLIGLVGIAAAQTRQALPQSSLDGKGFPRVEVTAGLTYANLRLPTLSDRKNAVGWGTSITGNLTRHFGITGDFSGIYEPKCARDDVDCILRELLSTQITRYSSYQFMGGPQVRFGSERFSGFAHALFGGIRHRVELLDTTTGGQTIIKPGPQFAMAYGGGLDWNAGRNVGLRLFQVDFIPVRESSRWTLNVRVQAGVVFRFGWKLATRAPQGVHHSQTINVEGIFTFQLPVGFRETETGVDSFMSGYQRGRARFIFVCGDSGSLAYDEKHTRGLREDAITIDGKHATVRTFLYRFERASHHIAELNVGDWRNGRVELYMAMDSPNRGDMETAKQIFRSVKFLTAGCA